MDELTEFQTEVRQWLEENCPQSMRTPMPDAEACWGGRNAKYKNPDSKRWMDRMASRGWTTPTWPKEYGGGGLTKKQNKILQRELGRIKARPSLQSFGIWMLGPALLQYGNEAQKQQYLPKIVRGEIRWCQGYSEPGAGSDLAGLQTKAVLTGDHYVVNGSKIWTSYANYADWIFCLVRTDPEASKHNGISFLLIDMDDPGVSTKPIQLISGASPFCETFLNEVRVPKENLVGGLNKGWSVAKTLLQHERDMIGGIGGQGIKRKVEDYAKDYIGEADGKLADPVLRNKLAQYNMDSRAFKSQGRRFQAELRAGSAPGAISSAFKYYGSELNKRKYEILLECMGNQALGWEGDGFSNRELSTTREWLRSKANSIEGGTSEVQLNIIAKRILGLPD